MIEPFPKVVEYIRVNPQRLLTHGRERIDYYLILFFFDFLAVLCAILIAVELRILLAPLLKRPYTWSLAWHTFLNVGWVFFSVLFFLFYVRVYDRRLSFWDETREIAKASFLSFVFMFALLALQKKSYQTSRLLVILLFFSFLFFLPVMRFLVKKILFSFSIYRRKAIIVGAGEGASRLARALWKENYLGYEVIGFLDNDRQKWGTFIEGKKVFGSIKHLGKFVSLLGIDSVFVAVPSFSSKELTDLFASVQSKVKEVCIVPDFKNFGMLNTEAQTLINDQLFLLKVRNNLRSPLNQFIKRSFDFVFALSLLPFLLPIMLLISLLIMLESPGSPIFIHRRVGKYGNMINVYKFRTMYKNSDEILRKFLKTNPEALKEWEIYYKLKDDPRVTKVGKFLRKTSLDELPQIFNVLLGNMSFVGPRPVTWNEIKSYYKDFANFYFLVNPGITGLWQVSGRNKLSYEDRVKLDTWYVLNWSLWLDISILLRTVRVVFLREGSY